MKCRAALLKSLPRVTLTATTRRQRLLPYPPWNCRVAAAISASVFAAIDSPRRRRLSLWISADDRGALFLSTDATPDNKIVIAFTPDSTASGDYEKHPEQATGPIALKAGQRYYLEVLYKQDDGKNNLSVAWQIPGEEREVIDGQYLAPFKPE